MGAVFDIVSQKSLPYLDPGGELVRGYEVRALVKKWNEIFTLNVPRLDATLIDGEIRKLIAEREKLDKLGG
jgi:hypothetical protein